VSHLHFFTVYSLSWGPTFEQCSPLTWRGGVIIINDEAYEYCTIEFTCYLKGVHKLVGLG
jgi:hypothetical protein